MQWRSRSRTRRVEDDARTSADVKLSGKQLTAQQKYERRQDTVIHFIFVAKIFSYTKNVQKYFTRINFTTKIFPTLVGSILHTSIFRIAAAHISRYTWPLTQQAISFSPAIISARGAISSTNAHHTRLVELFSFNLVCLKIVLREYFFYEILLDEKKRITVMVTRNNLRVSTQAIYLAR